MEEEEEHHFFGGLIAGALIMVSIFGVSGVLDRHLSDETMSEICRHLEPGNENYTEINAYADINGRLVCEYPSYDNTQNIILKTNNEDIT